MKTIVYLLFISSIGIGASCEKDNEPSTGGGSSGTNTLYSIGDCGSFFDQGDYSTVCFIDDPLPDDTLMASSSSSVVNVCHYVLVENWGVSLNGISVKLYEYSTVLGAQYHFDQGEIESPGGITITGVGDEGYLITEPGVGDPYGVRIGNVVIQLDDSSTGGPSNASCTDFQQEAALLVNEIINNLN